MRLEQRGGVAFTLMSGDRGDPPDHPVGISVLRHRSAADKLGPLDQDVSCACYEAGRMIGVDHEEQGPKAIFS
jgi:hypothetical protein